MMYDSDDELVEIKVRREYENFGYPQNENDSENEDPFIKDPHGFQYDSVHYKNYLNSGSKDHGISLSYEEACKTIESNANRDILEIKNDTSCLYTCVYCGLIFTHPKRFLIHYKWHNFGPSKEDIDASELPKKRIQKGKKEETIVKKESEDEGSYPCDVCNQIYRNKRSLHNHRNRVHFSTPKGCHICGKTFNNTAYLNSHMASHDEDKRFMCSQCPKTFKFLHSLQRHIPTHCEDKNFPCVSCDKSFGSDLLLKIHIKTHVKPVKGKAFKCSFCPKSFYQGFCLQAHERTHTGERPFECNLCMQKYPTNSSLSRHLKVSHGGALPFPCSQCSKSFHIQSARDHHVRRSHHRERPHACYCGAAFSCKSELIKHSNKNHAIDPMMLIGHSMDEVPSAVKRKKQKKKKKEYSDESS